MPYAHPEALVSTDWLEARLGDPAITILDATYTLPGVTPAAHELYARRHIPGAVFYDIETIADPANPLPHMMPAPEEFARMVGLLGVGAGQRVVVYDGPGLGTAPRVWWSLRLNGFTDVVVLNGGFARWKEEGRPVTDVVPVPTERRFTPRLDVRLLRDKAAILANLGNPREQVVDARSAARFAGAAQEPRPGLRSGHIPGSVSLPSDQLSDPATHLALAPEALEARLRAAGLSPETPVVASCGSGVSACVVAFAMHLVGWPEAAIYDGSWSEWGLPGDTPIATGPA